MNDFTLTSSSQHLHQYQKKIYQSYFIWMLLTLMLVPLSTSISSIFYIVLCFASLYHITVQKKWHLLLSHPFTRYFWSGAALVLVGILYSTSSWSVTLTTAQKYIWLLATPLFLISINGNHSLKNKYLCYCLYLIVIATTLIFSFYRIYTLTDYFAPGSNLQLNIIFKDHIIQSLMFVVGLHLCLYHLIHEKNLFKKVSYAVFAITLLANLLFINDGRIGYILVIVTGIYFIFYQLELKKALILAFLSILAMSAVITLSPIMKHRINTFINAVNHYQIHPQRYSSFSARANNWKVGYALFKEHPLFGHGTGGIYQAQKTYYLRHKIDFKDMLSNPSAFFQKSKANCATSKNTNHLCGDKLLDSSFLNFALQYGVLGIAFCFYFLVGLWRLSNTLSPLDRYIARVILLSYMIGLWINPWLSSSAPTHLVSLLFAFIYAKPKVSSDAT